jgi:hypothetical protein
MGKSTEITDMVLQQQPENEFCNLTDTLTNNLNSINNNNNNKINNGSHDENFEAMATDEAAQDENNILTSNDDNNNSNDNFNSAVLLGPETDVDAIEDEEFHYNVAAAGGGEKEKHQMELKETDDDDVTDRVEVKFDNGSFIDKANAMFGNIEKMSLENPDLVGAMNPFENVNIRDSAFMNDMINPIDNRIIEEQMNEIQQEVEHGANELMEHVENIERNVEFAANEGVNFTHELLSANAEEEIAMEEKEENAPQMQSGKLKNLFI